MTARARVLLPALALAAALAWTALPSSSQTMPPPPATMPPPAPGAMAPQAGMPDVIGGAPDEMMAMMMMRGMMARRAAMTFGHVEGRIAFLKTELKITEAQMPQWDRFADVLRATSGSMSAAAQQMMQAGFPATLPDRLDLQEKMLSARLDALKSFRAAVEPLYATLSDEQKQTADELMLRPMMGLM